MHTLGVRASVDPNVPLPSRTTSPDTGTRRTVDRVVIASSTGTAVIINVTLMRFAIDLVAPLCLVALLPRSIRDGIGDWLSGQKYDDSPDPLWAVCVTAVHLVAAGLSVIWIFSTSSWPTGTRFEGWVPGPIVHVASVGEAHGWGRRAILSGPDRQRADRSAASVVARTAESTPKDTSLLGSAAKPPDHDRTGTVGEHTEPPPVRGPEQAESITTTTALVSSVSVVRAGSAVQFTATVTAAGQHPRGAVRFFRGDAVLGSVHVDRNGRAVMTVTNLPAGEHTITAAFNGSAGFRPSRSQATVVFVTP